MTDDDHRTDDERAADEFDRLEHLYRTNPQVREAYWLDRQLDDHMGELKTLANRDPLGFIAFADRPGWVEKRLDALE